MKKLHVLILFGGVSAEHDVSVQSAGNILRAMRPQAYAPLLVYISREGVWNLLSDHRILRTERGFGDKLELEGTVGRRVLAVPHAGGVGLLDEETCEPLGRADCVFPVLHGPCGEDGTVQGMLTLWSVPYVGAGVPGSVIGMDKELTKRLLREAGIPVPDFVVRRAGERNPPSFENLRGELGDTLFVKPAHLGSSVGITRVTRAEEFPSAVERAFRFDSKIVIERGIEGREIECAVLEDDEGVSASLPGEILPKNGFYSYRAKYVDAQGARLVAPADLPADMTGRVRRLAVEVFRALCCEGMARVDFFIDGNGSVFVNEINTIPGFTAISMYPKLWEVSGVPTDILVDRLIAHALRRHARETEIRERAE